MKFSKFLRLASLTLLLTLPFSDLARTEEHPLFPEPPGLEDSIQFWTRIYSQVDSNAGLVHDMDDLGIVYEEVMFPEGSTSRSRERLSERRKKHFKTILLRLAKNRPAQPDREERQVLALFPSDVSGAALRKASLNLRFQTGQADKFKDGLIRAGAYANHVSTTLNEMGLPPELIVLPHVESSYTPHAYSRAGAAGLWQFTRSTGRRFMRVDHIVDERLDPYVSTKAAARLLQQNRRVTGSWPLAITAYNHGASGMRRAVRKLGTDDIAVIARDYKSRTFGFASRNFYAEFIAALRITRDPEAFFGPIEVEETPNHEYVELPFYTTTKALTRELGIKKETLRQHNPALLDPVWTGQKRIPRGFSVRVPKALLSGSLQDGIQSIPPELRFAYQTPDTYHRVQRGETLSHIAARYGVGIRELQTLNNLRNRHHIRSGQKLRLPGSTSRAPTMHLAADGRYTIQRGDTLEKIGRHFGVSEAQLIATNDIRNRHRIQAGQVLRIPSKPDAQLAAAQNANPVRLAKVDVKPSAIPAEAAQAEAGVMARTEAETLSTEAQLLADPSDYAVSADGTIEVQMGETLGHYADWLDIRASRLRNLNAIPYGADLQVHRHIRLDFSSVSRLEFERKRIEFHEDIQEAFFAKWEITGAETHRLKRGDSLWVLSHRKFRIPLWLLQQYNPDLDFSATSAGSDISVPLIKRRAL
ncbi:MAG: LysM peptidoglycan-binding domain-containing protein [Myxococcota bacterium]